MKIAAYAIAKNEAKHVEGGSPMSAMLTISY